MSNETILRELFTNLQITQNLWSKDVEKGFFEIYLNNKKIPPEKLFYKLMENGMEKYYAYYPQKLSKTIDKKDTLQSRNSYIGEYTEKFVKYLFEQLKVVKQNNLYVKNKVACEELGLTSKTPADVIISLKEEPLSKEDILLIGEVKMSIVWNWSYNPDNKANLFQEEGDFTEHTGQPSLLRSDSMLKAIGKAVNIRLNNFDDIIPVIIICNTPIQNSYVSKIDNLFLNYFIQGILSLNPHLENINKINKDYIFNTPTRSIVTINNFEELNKIISNLIRMRNERKKQL
ncbi:hypothetical protein [Thermoanaerobacter sp. RKWS2]|uniref:hypothetical protein n=1 Tax=Thermoanaerobacter sp. RKWS2 TaxID=2983842 RepID=UPI00224AE874|nr:hypothetical protein [Thermoanaerobacter sp. RKWS2]UZQ81777.1 hypothetical protein OEI98_001514 [Thermoanaerobacter sp. RKWS2]